MKIAILAFAGLFFLAFLLFTTGVLDSRPEVNAFKIYLKKNEILVNEFGIVYNVEYLRNGSSVSFKTNEISGATLYKISGSKKIGFTKVYWKRNKKDLTACVEELSITDNFSTENTIPWINGLEKCVELPAELIK